MVDLGGDGGLVVTYIDIYTYIFTYSIIPHMAYLLYVFLEGGELS